MHPSNHVFKDDDAQILKLMEDLIHEKNEDLPDYLEIMRCNLIKIIILTLLGISREMHFSLPYLSAKFNSDMGISFMEYLQKVRIEQSCRLLANTKLRIPEVAALAGYNNINSFNRAFKKIMHITPRDFRKQNT